jgi:hypothetical protein
MPIIKNITFIMGCGLVVILRRGEWNELTRHPKDRGKDQPNSRTNYLQQGENDVDCIAISLFYFLNRLYVVILLELEFWESLLGLGLWGYLCHILLGIGFWAINICL